jgi:hypothetical protein
MPDLQWKITSRASSIRPIWLSGTFFAQAMCDRGVFVRVTDVDKHGARIDPTLGFGRRDSLGHRNQSLSEQ